MTRPAPSVAAQLVAILVVAGAALSCATSPAPGDGAGTIDAKAPSVRVFDGAPDSVGAGASAGGADVLELLEAWEVARLEAQVACATGGACARVSVPEIDEATARAILTGPARMPGQRSVRAKVARALVDGSLAVAAAERSARRRSLTFREEGVTGAGAVFALDDITLLVAQAPRARRAAWLAASRPALERAEDIAAEERAVLDALAARLGVTRAALVAQRAGVDDAELRALIAGVLQATAPLLGPVASDVTLLPDVRAGHRPRRLSRAPLDPRAGRGDPIVFDAVVSAVRLGRPAELEGARAAARALVLDVRTLALASQAVLQGGGVSARDALASRILDDTAEPLAGASALLPADEAGVVVERFVAALRTPAVVQALWSGATMDQVVTRWFEAPVVEEQGFPEAFVEVVKVLPELAR